MSQKIAVAVIHGIGNQKEDFASEMIDEITEHFSQQIKGLSDTPEEELVFEPVWWAPVLQKIEDAFLLKVQEGGPLDFMTTRKFMIGSIADGIAYQPIPGNREIYDNIHAVVAAKLRELALATDPKAPLCIIAHSLGTIVASNYLWDLQNHVHEDKELIAETVQDHIQATPLEMGDTLANFYTLGSPLALWGLRWSDSKYPFGKPMQFPPARLEQYHPGIQHEWINFYDRDDVVGYPLRSLNDTYAETVTEDREVSVGKFWQKWGPASHLGYWKSKSVLEPIAESLARTWKFVNGAAVGR